MNIYSPSTMRSSTLPVSGSRFGGIFETRSSNILLYGQGTDLGTVRGTVADPSGAFVAQAAVTLTDTSTGASRQTKTNGDGAYEMFGLRSRTYKVSVQASGFAQQEINGV